MSYRVGDLDVPINDGSDQKLDIHQLPSNKLNTQRCSAAYDIKQAVDIGMGDLPVVADERREKRNARVKIVCDEIVADLKKINDEASDRPERFLIDQYVRNPYKRFQDSRTQLNQILIRLSPDKVTDMAELSPVIAHAEPFSLSRVYTFRDDTDAYGVIENVMRTKIQEGEKL